MNNSSATKSAILWNHLAIARQFLLTTIDIFAERFESHVYTLQIFTFFLRNKDVQT